MCTRIEASRCADADVCARVCVIAVLYVYDDKACNIQRCLSQNNHNADKCTHEIREWQECVDRVKERNGEATT